MDIPPLGLGTWGMGGRFESDRSNYQESVKILRAAIELGYRLFDVAEIYGAGLTETILGEAIKGTPRENIYITSKVWRDNLRAADVAKAIDGTLERLETDYVDLYLVHWPNPEVPLSETMPAMESLLDQGKARAIGVSNFSASQMAEAQKYLRHAKLYANQIEYNLATRSAESETIPYCQKHGIKVIAYRPLAKGQIALKDSPIVADLAAKYGKSPTQIVLNWLICQNTIPIPKAGTLEHLKDNFGALGWQMDAPDVERLGRLYK